MQIAFSEIIDTNRSTTSKLRTSLLGALAKRIWLQSILLCVSLLLGIALIASAIAQGKSLLLGILTSGFFFSLVAWYLVHIWYESEWIDSIETAISSNVSSNLPSETRAWELFEEAQMLRSPNESLIRLPRFISYIPGTQSLQSLVDSIIQYFFWKKRLDIIEALMTASASARIEAIQSAPLDPKAHAELANCFVTLSQLFQEAKVQRNRYGFYLQLPFPKYSTEVEAKHRQYAHLAVQELTIISEFAQDAIWVLEQLALSYKELHMPSEELKSWQKVLSIDPDDVQALVRSGLLAFQLKMPKIGLEAYSKLKELSPMQAEEVIAAYKGLLT